MLLIFWYRFAEWLRLCIVVFYLHTSRSRPIRLSSDLRISHFTQYVMLTHKATTQRSHRVTIDTMLSQHYRAVLVPHSWGPGVFEGGWSPEAFVGYLYVQICSFWHKTGRFL